MSIGIFRKKRARRISAKSENTIAFYFNGKRYWGRPGDSVAAALLANNVRLIGRSFKYHRPRGILSAGSGEPNALVALVQQDGTIVPNCPATLIKIRPGLVVKSQNGSPTLHFDLKALIQLFSPLLGPGFYYKTFMWPRSAWFKLYEPVIRAMSGLGAELGLLHPAHHKDRDQAAGDLPATRFAHTSLLIIGAGPAGLVAAEQAAKAGLEIMICDENSRAGGSLLGETKLSINDQTADQWVQERIDFLHSHPNVTFLNNCTAFACNGHNFVSLDEKIHITPSDKYAADQTFSSAPNQRLWHVRADHILLAAGAHEQALVFPDNDRPGIMLSSAALVYLNQYDIVIGRRITLLASEDSTYHTAFALQDAGANICAIADLRAALSDELQNAAEKRNIPLYLSHGASAIFGTKNLRGITLCKRRLNQHEKIDAAGETHIRCDTVLMGGGWVPALHLFSQARQGQANGRLIWNEDKNVFLPAEPNSRPGQVDPIIPIGAASGNFELSQIFAQAEQAARAIAGDIMQQQSAGEMPIKADAPTSYHIKGAVRYGSGAAGYCPLPPHRSDKSAFVDFQTDVTQKDMFQAIDEGFHSIEHIKRYTNLGRGTDQGKSSNMNGLMIAAHYLNKPIQHVGHTTYRPPFHPVSFALMASHGLSPPTNHGLDIEKSEAVQFFDPLRKTPIDAWAEAEGAVFELVGQWRRARYFPQKNKNGGQETQEPQGTQETMAEATARETSQTRKFAGLLDASTLGKIEVRGPDARRFLDLVYTCSLKKLKPGRCRYGLMAREDGSLLDDGVIACLSETHFVITTTSSGLETVFAHLEDYRQTEFTNLTLWLTSVTEQWAAFALSGPYARAIISPFISDIDLSETAMPHMAIRQGHFSLVTNRQNNIEEHDGAHDNEYSQPIPLRLYRASFTGEAGYELHIPAHCAAPVWRALLSMGAKYHLTYYGTQAMHIMRAEKGYILIGQDSDRTTTPLDAGLGFAVNFNKHDFIGKAAMLQLHPGAIEKNTSQHRPANEGSPGPLPARPELVGLRCLDAEFVADIGAQIIEHGHERGRQSSPPSFEPANAIGHVTSAYFSAQLGYSIAFALIENGHKRRGEDILIAQYGKTYEAFICDKIFYDISGARHSAHKDIDASGQEHVSGLAGDHDNSQQAHERLHLSAPDHSLTLTQLDAQAHFDLRIDPKNHHAFAHSSGLSLPEQIMTSAQHKDANIEQIHMLKIGPDHWLLTMQHNDLKGFTKLIEPFSPNYAPQGLNQHSAVQHSISLIDISAALSTYNIEGAKARRCLQAACPLDLRDHAFPPGAVSRTVFGKTAITLWHRGANQYQLFCARSFAPYIELTLTKAFRQVDI